MEDEKLTIEKLKRLLYAEVHSMLEAKENLNYLNLKLEILDGLIKMIKNSNFDYLSNNKLMICMQLDSIFENSIYIDDFLNTMARIENSKKNNNINNVNKEIHEFYNRLFNKYEEMLAEAELLKQTYNLGKIKEYRTVISRLKFRQPLAKNLYHSVYKFLEEKNYDKLLIVRLCEYIRVYNKSSYSKYRNDSNKYEIFNMINDGYEMFPKISINPKKDMEIDKFISNLVESSKDYIDDFETYKQSLPVYDQNIYDETEYKKICYDFLSKIQQEIYDIVALIKEEDFYFDNDVKIDVLKEYKKKFKLYKKCRDFFDDQIKNIKEENYLEEKEEFIDETVVKTNFLFAMSNDMSYIERDLKTVPEEYYDKIKELLLQKRYGLTKKTNDKQLINNEKLKQFRELKEDQIRIIYRNSYNNSIIILGVGVKKSDVDRNLYDRLAKRNNFVNDNTLKLNDDSKTLERVLEICNQNKRKGNR